MRAAFPKTSRPHRSKPAALRHNSSICSRSIFARVAFLIATNSEGAAARVIRDLGFAAFVNAPSAFIARIDVRDVDQMIVMQVSALTDWFAEVDLPVGKIYGLHYPPVGSPCRRRWRRMVNMV